MSRLSRLVRAAVAFAGRFSHDEIVALPPPLTRPRIGLALGGGFARGIAHIGVLKVLEEERIPIDFIAGTSSGAIIGAMYCSGLTAREIERRARTVRFRDFARWTVCRLGFCSSDRMATFLDTSVKCKRFEDLKIPLAVAATDYLTGEEVIFRHGSLLDALRASCAYPGMFQPVEVKGRLMVDGLFVHPVPVQPLRRMGAERVLGVHLKARALARPPRHMFEVIGQCFTIVQEKLESTWKGHTDVVIEPDVNGVSYDAFERAEEMIRAGERAARAALPAIRRLLPAESLVPQQAPAHQPMTAD